ncbi:hypothetical protein SALB1_1303 [Salinisphaera sp. LB1]|nr:hypothetical protein SALB1_1303 [Salinisphaera sp. LB1]
MMRTRPRPERPRAACRLAQVCRSTSVDRRPVSRTRGLLFMRRPWGL